MIFTSLFSESYGRNLAALKIDEIPLDSNIEKVFRGVKAENRTLGCTYKTSKTKRRFTKRRQDKTSTHQNVDYNKTSTTTKRRKVRTAQSHLRKKSSYNFEKCTFIITLFLG
jgi:hypothetical protein